MDNEYQYREIGAVSQEEMWAALRRNDSHELSVAILALALHHDDRSFVEETCLKLAAHPNFHVRANAIEGFGHIARRFGALNEGLVRPIIEGALNDPSEFVRGKASDAADDIAHFLG